MAVQLRVEGVRSQIGVDADLKGDGMKFRYEAHDRMSNPKKGEIEAKDQEEAASRLREMDLFVLHVEEAGPGPHKTVLDHDKLMNQGADVPPDIETEIEMMKEEAGAEEAHEFKSDVTSAWKTCMTVRSHLEEAGVNEVDAKDVAFSVLKELLAEMSIRELQKGLNPRAPGP